MSYGCLFDLFKLYPILKKIIFYFTKILLYFLTVHQNYYIIIKDILHFHIYGHTGISKLHHVFQHFNCFFYPLCIIFL